MSAVQSGTPEVKSAVAQRITIAVTELIDFAENRMEDASVSSHVWVLKSLFSAMSDELNGASDEILGKWISQFGKLLEWCGTGDNSLLPPELVEYLTNEHPQILAIEA